jgi:hypothetical protein
MELQLAQLVLVNKGFELLPKPAQCQCMIGRRELDGVHFVKLDVGLILRLGLVLCRDAVIDVFQKVLESIVQLLTGCRLACLEFVQFVLELFILLSKVTRQFVKLVLHGSDLV